MQKAERSEPRRWVPLGEACHILEVNQSTLRQWADKGYLRSFRTPGGHRRFARVDIESLTQSRKGLPAQSAAAGREAALLKLIRRRLRSPHQPHSQLFESLDEEARSKMRIHGRRLLSFIAQEGARRSRRRQSLAEARLLGEDYGREIQSQGILLMQALETFLFFRNSLAESPSGVSWQQLALVSDQVLLGITQAYCDGHGSLVAPLEGKTG